MRNHLSFINAETVAMNHAYKMVFGDLPIGIGIAIIRDRNNGNPWTDSEKKIGTQLVNDALGTYYRIEMDRMISDGTIRDCRMSRDFLNFGNGLGYRFKYPPGLGNC